MSAAFCYLLPLALLAVGTVVILRMFRRARLAEAPKPKEPTHVDEFIDDHTAPAYPRFVLHHFRLRADLQIAFVPFVVKNLLFCDFEGKRYRVTGASRLGDLCLNSDFTRDHGYQRRVFVEHCSNWGAEP